MCCPDQGDLGLIDFWSKGKALRLSSFVKSLSDPSFKCFYLVWYFCGSRLATLRPEWSTLGDIRTPNAASLSKFYSRMIDLLKSCSFPGSFAFDSKSIYKEIIKRHCSLPVLPRFWSRLLSRSFSLPRHWSFVRDSFTENYESDLSWLITLRTVKVRESLRNWGYIDTPSCATCSQTESIDHCFRACPWVKAVWFFFLPLLSSPLSQPFPLCGASIFFFQLPFPNDKSRRLLLFLIKSILYGIWRFRNKAVFHNGRGDSGANTKYIIIDIKNRIKADRFRFSPSKFPSLWCHPALRDFHQDDNLVFKF